MKEKLRKALREQAEARQAFNALGDHAAEADVAAAEARAAAADQAVIEALAEDEGSGDGPAELRDRISLGRYLHAFAEDRVADGAEAEMRQELGLSDQAIPLEALLPTPEERADAVSPQNAAGDAALDFGTVYHTTGPLLNRVFTATDGAFLGISMPTVPPGERVFPVMVGGTDAAMAARGDAGADAASAKFDVVNATPHRLTGRYVFDLEGVATLGGLLESTLRADLRTVMGYQFDRQLLLGSGAGANVEGLMTALPLEALPGAVFDGNDVPILNWIRFKSGVTDTLDGRYARTEANERWLIGKDTYSLARTLYRGNANSGNDWDGIQAVRELGARVGVSFQIPASAVATIPPKTADSTKKVQSAIVNMEPAAAVAPVWQGITMIRDPYTEASKAQVVLTAHMLFDFVMRRKDGWKRYAIRTES